MVHIWFSLCVNTYTGFESPLHGLDSNTKIVRSHSERNGSQRNHSVKDTEH